MPDEQVRSAIANWGPPFTARGVDPNDFARVTANANDIADFLSAANARFWPGATMRAAMKEHLDQTLAEAVDELNGNYAASVADYEAIHLHRLAMADLLSSGIMHQFPARFR
jgi:hypothetical protein